MDTARTGGDALAAPRRVILALLLALAAASWAWLLALADHGSGAGAMAMRAAMSTPTMGMGALPFVAVWVVMMVAMMFPTAAPMILAFHRVQSARRRERGGGAFVPSWILVAGYLLVWALAGAAAYGGALAAEGIAARAGLTSATAARIGGAVLVTAGLYQLTPLKDLCLSKCRTPVGFIMTSWREGASGALRMGLLHGAYCLGCCWLLFAVLFPLGLMNVAAMAVATVLIFVEKTSPWGRAASRVAAALLVAYGLVVLVFPPALPTFARAASGTAATPGGGAATTGMGGHGGMSAPAAR